MKAEQVEKITRQLALYNTIVDHSRQVLEVVTEDVMDAETVKKANETIRLGLDKTHELMDKIDAISEVDPATLGPVTLVEPDSKNNKRF